MIRNPMPSPNANQRRSRRARNTRSAKAGDAAATARSRSNGIASTAPGSTTMLVDLLEPLFRPRVLVHVRMVLPGQPSVGLLYLLPARVARHAEHVVEVAGHGQFTWRWATVTAAGRSWRPGAP